MEIYLRVFLVLVPEAARTWETQEDVHEARIPDGKGTVPSSSAQLSQKPTGCRESDAEGLWALGLDSKRTNPNPWGPAGCKQLRSWIT